MRQDWRIIGLFIGVYWYSVQLLADLSLFDKAPSHSGVVHRPAAVGGTWQLREGS